MKTHRIRTDANGRAQIAGAGLAYSVSPWAGLVPSNATNFSPYAGGYPVTVRRDGSPGTDVYVHSAGVRWASHAFHGLELVDATPSADYAVTVLDAGEALGPVVPQRRVFSLSEYYAQDLALVDAPVNGSEEIGESFPLLSSWRVIEFAFLAGATPVPSLRVYVQQPDSAKLWFLSETLSATTRVHAREVLSPGGRMYLQWTDAATDWDCRVAVTAEVY